MILLFKRYKKYIFNYYDSNIAFTKIADFFYLFENFRKIKATNYKFSNFSSSEKIRKKLHSLLQHNQKDFYYIIMVR